MQKITPFLWFDKEAGDAAKFYTSVFKDVYTTDEEILKDTPSGEVQLYTIELLGQQFTLMNAGPLFKFNEAISFMINCQDQEEVDYYWAKLTADGGEESMCGWLKDKFGVSWQVVPKQLGELLAKDPTGKVMNAMLKMKKLDIAELEKALNENLTKE